MKRPFTLLLLASLAIALPSSAGWVTLNGYATLSHSGTNLTSAGEADWGFDTIPCPVQDTCTYNFSGTHAIRESNGGGAVTSSSWTVPSTYHATIHSGGATGACYFAETTSFVQMTSTTASVPPAAMPWTLGTGGPYRSSSDCIPAPPPPPPPPLEEPACATSPIILNMGTGDYQLTGTDDPVSFDINADGVPNRISWTARNAPMAFLALDRNRNGSIDSGAELFGNSTPLPDGSKAPNGFEALAPFDTNHDGVIDAHDPVWRSLTLWTDRNHDGVSQAGELQPIGASSVSSVGLRYRETRRRDSHGNLLRYAGTARIGRAERICYDVFFLLARH